MTKNSHRCGKLPSSKPLTTYPTVAEKSRPRGLFFDMFCGIWCDIVPHEPLKMSLIQLQELFKESPKPKGETVMEADAVRVYLGREFKAIFYIESFATHEVLNTLLGEPG